MPDKDKIAQCFKGLQNDICKALERADGAGLFSEDNWIREGGGGGCTRVMQTGHVIEKGGVAFSAVHGPIPDFLKSGGEQPISVGQVNPADVKNEHTADSGADDQAGSETFYATGVSIVIHPQSPMVPVIHMNVRYFETSNGKKWFGGGIDLTPHYVNEQDAVYFHSQLKKVCDKFNSEYYVRFKKWADDYFFIVHRNETRGVGGIFFDHLAPEHGQTWEQVFAFVKSVGELFAPTYTELISRNKSLPYGEREKQWQLLRRGRYVEFNLVYDRGTRFGLETGGRIESILMSLPHLASWTYNYTPVHGSKEEQTLGFLKKGINWV